MRYTFIDDHQARWPVAVQCDVLDATRSSYYVWRRRGPSPRAVRRQEITEQIREVHTASRQTYGAPRVRTDLFTRQIVGWSMSERIDSRLVVDALEMALTRQRPDSGLTAHSDRGVQYAGEHYQRQLQAHGITCSMSRKGNCWDNAPTESFFATLTKELVHDEGYRTRAAAGPSLFESIEAFYDRQRRHSALGCQTPAQFAEAA